MHIFGDFKCNTNGVHYPMKNNIIQEIKRTRLKV